MNITLEQAYWVKRVLWGGKVCLGDCVTLSAEAGGGSAFVLWEDSALGLHVTGVYEDGSRWWDWVAPTHCRFASARQTAKLERAFEAAGEMDRLGAEIAYNREFGNWETISA